METEQPTESSKEKLSFPRQEKLQIGEAFEEYCQRIVEMLPNLEDMQSGRLNRANLAKHRINLTPKA